MDRADRDSDVIAASRATPASFATIFDRHFDAIHAYLQRRIGRDLADELAAETFLLAFDGRAGYDVARPDARPWLFGIATNLLRRHRRHDRCTTPPDDPAPGSPSPTGGTEPGMS